jgi:hypothetical protein
MSAQGYDDEGWRYDEPVVNFPERDGWYDTYASYEHYDGSRDLGELTTLVLINDQLVDTVRKPVLGSGYERVARDLGRGSPAAPPRERIVEVPAQPRHELQRTWLRLLVGGAAALEQLDSTPLPEDEPAALDDVRAELRERIGAILESTDTWALDLFGTEVRTACRRLAVRAVAAEPALLTGSDRDDSAAAALLYAVAKGNDLVGAGRALPATVFYRWVGLKSSPQDRARRFAHAVAGVEPVTAWHSRLGAKSSTPDVWNLGSADFLTSTFRRHLLRARDLADAEAGGAATAATTASTTG